MGRRKAILFDFGGTLDADGLPWKERFHLLYHQDGLTLDAESFAPLFYVADDRLVGALPRTAGLRETVECLVGNLDPLLPPGHGGRPARIGARFLADASACFARNRPILDELAGTFRLGIVSNFYGNLAAVCREMEIESLFDVIVDSTVVGASKPDAAIFEAALGPLGVEASACAFVGDSLRRDWAGAKRMGMPFIWIEHPGMTKPGAQQPRHRIPSLSHLPAVLGVIDDAA